MVLPVQSQGVIHVQIKKHVTLIDSGGFSETPEFSKIMDDITSSIKKVVHPPESDKFTIYPESGKKRGKGNGVKPIKLNFISHLVQRGWEDVQNEKGKSSDKKSKRRNPGSHDAIYRIGDKCFAVEWETGNISSSHRAINKMVLGILKGELVGGALILPTRELYRYLTDRIGNYEELEPYFDLWRVTPCRDGYLGIFAVQHDDTSYDVPRIPKRTDGRALQ